MKTFEAYQDQKQEELEFSEKEYLAFKKPGDTLNYIPFNNEPYDDGQGRKYDILDEELR